MQPFDHKASAPFHAAAPDPTDDQTSSTVHLRVMATSDLHMHLAAYDYFADRPSMTTGLAMTASLIAAARAEVANTILLDNGDFLQGSPFGDFTVQQRTKPNPMVAAMNHLRYDAATLGNHEFSHGLDYLLSALGDAAFPIVSANVHRLSDGTPDGPLVPGSVILERTLVDQAGQPQGLRIGITGVLPPQTAIWDRQAILGRVHMTGITAAARREVRHLKQQGAEIVIVLAHCGLGDDTAADDPLAEHAALAVAAIDGVDAVIGGHIHLAFPGPGIAFEPGIDPVLGSLHGKPAVMAGFFGSHLGVIDLTLAQGPQGWHIRQHKSQTRPIALRDAMGNTAPLVRPNPVVTKLIRKSHSRALAWVRRPIGRTVQPIHSFFAMVTDCPSVRLVNAAQTAHVRDRLSGGPWAGVPVLSAAAPFKAGGRAGPENFCNIPPGKLLLRHAVDLYLHPNSIVALALTGQEVRHWLEQSATVFRQISPGGQDQPLLQDGMPSFLFDHISGISYSIDLARPPGQRLQDIRWNGQPLPDEARFVLATNSYRGSGSGSFVTDPDRKMVLAEGVPNRDVVISHLARQADLADTAPPSWRFASMPGTSVVFDSAPDAAHHMQDAPHLNLTALARTAEGFLRFRLHL